MGNQKKFVTVMLLLSLVIAAVASVKPSRSKYKNLQILPTDIPEQKMDSIMKSYTRALGMGCGFCHTPLKDFPDSLDYAADNNEMKENARKMMRMTIDINKNNFYYDTTIKPVYLNTVNCNTCHRGEPYPLN